MVKVFAGTDKEFYMDGYLQSNLDMAKKAIKSDWDMIFVYDGYEGSGKSVKAMQDAYYCDPTLDINRIVFNADDFKAAVMIAKPYEAVVFDEAYGGLSSRGAMGMVNRMLVQMLTTIRQKNLFIFIVLPSFFDLDKYVALWRSRALIHIYSDTGFKRGYFAFYNMGKKKELYVNGKKFYDYGKPRPIFRGRFTNHYIIDKDIYKKKKIDTSITMEDTTHEYLQQTSRKVYTDIAQNLKIKELGLTQKQIAEILDVTSRTIRNYISKYEHTGDSLGIDTKGKQENNDIYT